MKKFNMAELKLVSTLMSSTTLLDLDEDGEAIDQREYRSMIGSLLYLMETCHSVRHVPLGALLGFSTLFTSDGSSANLQIAQTHF
jgi:hypothetical protein